MISLRCTAFGLSLALFSPNVTAIELLYLEIPGQLVGQRVADGTFTVVLEDGRFLIFDTSAAIIDSGSIEFPELNSDEFLMVEPRCSNRNWLVLTSNIMSSELSIWQRFKTLFEYNQKIYIADPQSGDCRLAAKTDGMVLASAYDEVQSLLAIVVHRNDTERLKIFNTITGDELFEKRLSLGHSELVFHKGELYFLHGKLIDRMRISDSQEISRLETVVIEPLPSRRFFTLCSSEGKRVSVVTHSMDTTIGPFTFVTCGGEAARLADSLLGDPIGLESYQCCYGELSRRLIVNFDSGEGWRTSLIQECGDAIGRYVNLSSYLKEFPGDTTGNFSIYYELSPDVHIVRAITGYYLVKGMMKEARVIDPDWPTRAD